MPEGSAAPASAEANRKQEETVNKLTQAQTDLAAAEGQLKALQGDLVTAMDKYEATMTSTYTATSASPARTSSTPNLEPAQCSTKERFWQQDPEIPVPLHL